jgi:hypothetical protein
MTDLPDPRREPTAEQRRPTGGVNYDIVALRRAVAAGQLPAEVLTEVEKEKENG